ncbi:MAG: HD domain-containing protein [Rhodocyclales bacterium]|nr:HD domain-containing protein [Rhodocyclales bacterium]
MFREDVSGLTRLATVLGAALHERDAYTCQHGDRVMQVALAVGRSIGLDSEELGRLHAAAMLHDIGKIGIPDEVLLNPGMLDPAQRAIMRSHAERGEKILRAISGDDALAVAEAVRHHHEEFDGSGYPDQLGGEDIPVLSRIISIADNYDAIASQRVYHGSRDHDYVIGVMHQENGQKHDPYLLGKFMDVIERSPLRVT